MSRWLVALKNLASCYSTIVASQGKVGASHIVGGWLRKVVLPEESATHYICLLLASWKMETRPAQEKIKTSFFFKCL